MTELTPEQRYEHISQMGVEIRELFMLGGNNIAIWIDPTWIYDTYGVHTTELHCSIGSTDSIIANYVIDIDHGFPQIWTITEDGDIDFSIEIGDHCLEVLYNGNTIRPWEVIRTQLTMGIYKECLKWLNLMRDLHIRSTIYASLIVEDADT